MVHENKNDIVFLSESNSEGRDNRKLGERESKLMNFSIEDKVIANPDLVRMLILIEKVYNIWERKQHGR